MTVTLKEHAENVLGLIKELPTTREPLEKEFRGAVWTLCNHVIDNVNSSDGGQFIPPSFL